MVKQYHAESGTAGALAVIAVLLAGMAIVPPGEYKALPLDELPDDTIWVENNVVYQGDRVFFFVDSQLLNYDIYRLMWDFHDNTSILVTSPDEQVIDHQFDEPGRFLVSILLLQFADNVTDSKSRIFTIPITVLPKTRSLEIESETIANEDEIINFQAHYPYIETLERVGAYRSITEEVEPEFPTEIEEYIWEFGDDSVAYGKNVSHSYTHTGIYTVRVRGYDENSMVYTGYKSVTINNVRPSPSLKVSANQVNEDDIIVFNASDTYDTAYDLNSLIYIWEFGDGLMGTGKVVSHQYLNDGIYTVKLTVIDNDGERSEETALIRIVNQVPVIQNISISINDIYEGDTIACEANIEDSQSDLVSMIYNWNIDADGWKPSVPFADDGNISIQLNVTDDNGAKSDISESVDLTVSNLPPIASLSAGYSIYNVTFRVWGETLGSKLVFELYHDDKLNRSGSLICESIYYTSNLEGYTFYNLNQPLEEYWDILVNLTTTEEVFDNWAEIEFEFEDGSSLSLYHHYYGSSEAESTWRFPVAPIDRGFPINLDFQVFDPGSDDVTVQVDFGSTVEESTITKQGSNPTAGTVTVIGSVDNITDFRYIATDEDGASSKYYYIPLQEYALDHWDAAYTNIPSWDRWGYNISHYAADAIWLGKTEIYGNEAVFFQIQPTCKNLTTLKYDWHFGDGDRSPETSPIHSYPTFGEYLVWVVLYDGYYDSVIHQWVNITNLAPTVQPFVQGFEEEGEILSFGAIDVGTYDDMDNLYYYWDFADNTYGLGRTVEHAYTHAGIYNVTLHVVDNQNTAADYTYTANITNTAPRLLVPLDNIEVSEGNRIILNANVTDSPYDMLSLSYTWTLEENIYNERLVSLLLENGSYSGTLTVTDPEGAELSENFTVTIVESPLEITIPNYYIYGSTNATLRVFGTLGLSIFDREDYRDNIGISYTLKDEQGAIIDSGEGEFYDEHYKFRLDVDTSTIGSRQFFEALYDSLGVLADLYNSSSAYPSGKYSLEVSAEEIETNQVISKTYTSISITVDSDGDFITDDLEPGYSKDVTTIYPWSSDSDGDGVVDPVEVVLFSDFDDDGLTNERELVLGTNMTNADTDGDGLKDGFDSEGFGEANHGTDPLSNDTDGDKL